MMGLLNGAISMPAVVGQVFTDVGGFLFGVEFLAALANLITTVLTTLVSDLLFGMIGGAG